MVHRKKLEEDKEKARRREEALARGVPLERIEREELARQRITPAVPTKDKPVGFVTSPRGAQFVVPASELSTEELARQAEERRLEDVRVEQEPIEAERARLFAEEAPVRRELDPFVTELEQVPIVGPLLNKVQRTIKKLLPFLDDTKFELTPEELRTVALTEIERIEIEKGLTRSEQFGSFAETIQLGELAKWIPGLAGAEKPSGNVQTIVKSLRQLKSRATDVELKFNKKLLTRSAANDRIRLIENELQAGESRIKLLIQDSPELKFNSDGVNFIEGKILEARERIFDAKLTTAGLPSSEATDLEVLQTLQESIAAEDFTIPGL